jgi:hypothetical protein
MKHVICIYSFNGCKKGYIYDIVDKVIKNGLQSVISINSPRFFEYFSIMPSSKGLIKIKKHPY